MFDQLFVFNIMPAHLMLCPIWFD
uniref:Uncharacterized protein n=1 Tax=Rhizophora mucronata TaxID=61149 RepID=A0A2P2PAG9_RHIMU